jgi:repressor LexA
VIVLPADINYLTLKQRKAYNAIEAFIKSKGIPPTVREIGEMVGEKTPGAVQGILNRLAQKGFIKRETGAARSIQIISENSSYAEVEYIPEISKISQRNVSDILSTYNIRKYQPVPAEILNISRDCFMIACPDNSLIENGITYDDILVIKPEAKLKNGDIILLLYESHLLLRKYYSTGSESDELIKLKAGSNLLNKEIFNRQEIKIIGKLAAKLTKYT